MRRIIALVLGTSLLAACSVAAAPSTDPVTVPPTESPGPASLMPIDPLPTEPPPTAAPTPAPIATPRPTPSPVAACAGDRWDDDLDRAMTLGGTPVRFQYQSAGPLDDSASGWSDSVPGPTLRFDMDSDHQVVEAASGTRVRLRPADVVAFTDGQMTLYELEANDRVDDNATPVDTADLAVVDGALTVPMPDDAGRWLLSIYGRWQTGCASGDGYVDLLLVTS